MNYINILMDKLWEYRADLTKPNGLQNPEGINNAVAVATEWLLQNGLPPNRAENCATNAVRATLDLISAERAFNWLSKATWTEVEVNQLKRGFDIHAFQQEERLLQILTTKYADRLKAGATKAEVWAELKAFRDSGHPAAPAIVDEIVNHLKNLSNE